MKLLPSIELLSNILNINKNIVQINPIFEKHYNSKGNISQVLKRNRKQSGGYKWKYQMNLER